MCSLPNFQALDLEVLSQRRKKQKEKTEGKPVEIIMPEYESMEKSIWTSNKRILTFHIGYKAVFLSKHDFPKNGTNSKTKGKLFTKI